MGIIGLLALAAGAGEIAARSLPAKTNAWIRLDTASLVLFSNTSESKTVEIAGRLEQFRAVLYQKLLRVEPSAAVPLYVYVFNNTTSLNPYKPASARAYFLPTAFAKHLVVNATPPAVTTMKARVQVEMGHPTPFTVGQLGRKWIPFGELMPARTPHGRFRDVPLFYAESWALVHYLILGGPFHDLNEYVNALRTGANYDQAFRDAFEIGHEGLQNIVGRYITADRLPLLVLPLEALQVPQGHRVTPLTYPEVLCRLGELLLADPARRDDAEQHFRAALEEAREYGPAWNGLARLLEAGGQVAEAAEPELREEARQAFAAAVRIRPELGEPYLAFGSLFLYEAEYVAGGEASLRKAWHLLPWRMDIPFALTLLHLKRGDTAAAARVAETALSVGPAEFLELLVADVGRLRPETESTPPFYAAQVEQILDLVAGLRADPENAAQWTRIESDVNARNMLRALESLGLAIHEKALPEPPAN